MKSFLNKTKNKIKIYFSFKKINPHKHWQNLLFVFLFIVFILGLFSFYLLYKVKKQEIFNFDPKSSSQVILIDEKLLKKVQESFEEKRTKEKEIKSGAILYNDPSLN
jgi:hypothetical protein